MKGNLIRNKGQIVAALSLTAILSVSSGLTMITSASAATNLLPETTSEALKENSKSTRLPRQVANAVIQDLTKKQNVSPRKLKIVDYSQQTWRDGCLELPQPDEFCTQALVPGWLVVASNETQKWAYHTNKDGSSLRLEPVTTSKNNQPAPAKAVNNIQPVPIPANELPPPLDQGVVFREIASGGITGRTYETVLRNDGILIRVRIGDANDSERSVRRVSLQQVKQFEKLLDKKRLSKYKNLSYPAPSGAADFITYTLTSQAGTFQYNDISQDSLPKVLQSVVQAWRQIGTSAQ
jgi:hypothetical protein